MPATTRGIYHNLKESKYTASNGEVVFYFSSLFYRNKFVSGYTVHRNLFKQKLEKTPLNMDTLSDVVYYEKVEKRGFFVRLDRARIDYNDLYKYAIRKMNEKVSPEWK